MNLAHPMASDDVREILATEQYLDGCIKRRWFENKQSRTNSENDVIEKAVELEAF